MAAQCWAVLPVVTFAWFFQISTAAAEHAISEEVIEMPQFEEPPAVGGGVQAMRRDTVRRIVGSSGGAASLGEEVLLRRVDQDQQRHQRNVSRHTGIMDLGTISAEHAQAHAHVAGASLGPASPVQLESDSRVVWNATCDSCKRGCLTYVVESGVNNTRCEQAMTEKRCKVEIKGVYCGPERSTTPYPWSAALEELEEISESASSQQSPGDSSSSDSDSTSTTITTTSADTSSSSTSSSPSSGGSSSGSSSSSNSSNSTPPLVGRAEGKSTLTKPLSKKEACRACAGACWVEGKCQVLSPERCTKAEGMWCRGDVCGRCWGGCMIAGECKLATPGSGTDWSSCRQSNGIWCPETQGVTCKQCKGGCIIRDRCQMRDPDANFSGTELTCQTEHGQFCGKPAFECSACERGCIVDGLCQMDLTNKDMCDEHEGTFCGEKPTPAPKSAAATCMDNVYKSLPLLLAMLGAVRIS